MPDHGALRASLVRRHLLCEPKSRSVRAIRFYPLFSRLIFVAFWLKYLFVSYSVSVLQLLCSDMSGLEKKLL